MTRPIFNPTNGNRIRYADSPLYDAGNFPIVYAEDRSDPTRWNQMTGEPANVNVTVNVAGAGVAPPAAQAQAQAAPQRLVTVQRLTDNAYETFPTFTTSGNRTVRDIRTQFRHDLGLRDTMVAIVNGEAVGDGSVVPDGAVITFREGAKQRG